jgi:hypothetical protein
MSRVKETPRLRMGNTMAGNRTRSRNRSVSTIGFSPTGWVVGESYYMWMLFDTNKIFRVCYQALPLQVPATQSLPSQELAVQFIRQVLNQQGNITGIKYDGKPVPEDFLSHLMEKAKGLKLKKGDPKPHLR